MEYAPLAMQHPSENAQMNKKETIAATTAHNPLELTMAYGDSKLLHRISNTHTHVHVLRDIIVHMCMKFLNKYHNATQ